MAGATKKQKVDEQLNEEVNILSTFLNRRKLNGWNTHFATVYFLRTQNSHIFFPANRIIISLLRGIV